MQVGGKEGGGERGDAAEGWGLGRCCVFSGAFTKQPGEVLAAVRAGI